jgi:hypothetical protein
MFINGRKPEYNYLVLFHRLVFYADGVYWYYSITFVAFYGYSKTYSKWITAIYFSVAFAAVCNRCRAFRKNVHSIPNHGYDLAYLDIFGLAVFLATNKKEKLNG